MRHLLGLATVVVALMLSSCNSVDEDTWRAEVEAETGSEIADWDAYSEVWTEACDKDEDELALFIAVGLDQGESLDLMRTNIKNACPDRLEEVERTRSDINGVEQACDTPVAERTEEQSLMAEAMGC